MSDVTNQSEQKPNEEMAAARQAANQAKEMAVDAVEKIKALEPMQLTYLGLMAFVVLGTIAFSMASFNVSTVGEANSIEAMVQDSVRTSTSAWAYSAFQSTLVGKLMWLSAAAGLGIVLWSTVAKARAPWIPLAQIGCAGGATLLMLLSYLVGFPDMSELESVSSLKINCSATLLGYWLPLLALGGATFIAVRRVMDR